jgi:hypothetical protein
MALLKGRKGSGLDINRDYLQVESEVLSQMMYDTQLARTIKRIDDVYNVAGEIKAGEIPEGYVSWQPREGNVFYRSHTIPEKVAMEATLEGVSELAGVDVRPAIVMGGKRKSFVIPQEVANALDSLTKDTSGRISNADKAILKKWKQWQLVSPRRFVKYNLRNITGDADAAFVGNPVGFKYVPKAARELYDVMAGRQSPKGEAKKIPLKMWNGYWEKARGLTDYREALLRYANYLSYLDQIKRSPEGRPANFGASLREEVMGLQDPNAKAYKLANELLGAYDDISPVGQALREHMIPFWSWNEVNFKRYKRFAENAMMDGKAMAALGRKVSGTAIKSPLIAYRIGKLSLKASALQGALHAWNTRGVPAVFGEDLESQLPERKKFKAHIILGRDEDGNVISFDRLGAFSDFLEWFGVDGLPAHVNAYMRGRKNLREIAGDMAQSPANKLWQGALPFAKLGMESVTRRATALAL